MAYDASFRGGVTVASADLTGDGKADIVTGAGPGGGPHVRVFDSATVRDVVNFFAYDGAFHGGVFVATIPGLAGGTGIITSPGAGGGPDVRVWSSHGLGDIYRFSAYDPAFRGGVTVASAPIGPNGESAILTGAGPGGGPHIRAFRIDATPLLSVLAFDPAFRGGVFVG